jgi:membrane fusion protein, multidrug efflux system
VTQDAQQRDREQPQQDKGRNDQKKLTPQQRRKRRRMFILAAFGAVLLLLLIVIWYLIFKRGRVSTDDAYTDGRAIGMSVKVTGYVIRLAVTDNQFVHAGDLLLEIDASDYRNALDTAAGQLAQVQAQIDAARLNVQVARTAQPSDLTSALANLEAAKATHEKAQADLERQRTVDPRATTRTVVDQASAQERTTAMQVRDAQARVNTARLSPQNIAIAEAQVKSLEAQQRSAEAQLQQSRLNLAYTQLRAPQDGRVTKRNVEMGDYVAPGQTLLQLVTPDLWVTANFKESQLRHMRPGQPVRLAVDAYPQLELHGHVDSVQMGSGARFTAFPSENATGNFVKIVQRVPVKILIDNGLPADWALPLGLSVVPTVDER